MYEHITYETIMKRMLDRIPLDVDKREGSIIYDALAPAGVELQLMYIEFDQIINNGYGDTAIRDYLVKRAAERGIEPYQATKAILQAEFTPVTIDLIGQRFSLELLNYVVVKKIKDGVYEVECETPGSEGNKRFGNLIPIDYIAGLQTAKLVTVLIPGDDEEETEHFRKRYFDSFDTQAFGGNVKDYLEKTAAISGVGSVKVTPIWQGGGTVLLTILDSDSNIASSTLIERVQDTIDPKPQGLGLGLAPIGHTVTVQTVNPAYADIMTQITYEKGYSWKDIEEQATGVIEAYFLELRQSWADTDSLIVRISQIETRLLTVTGILDISATTINKMEDNLILGAYEIPVLGGIGAW